MAKGKKVSKVQKRKKTWFKVLASPEFKRVTLGEIPAFDSDSLVGRVVRVNLMILTKDMRKQSFSASFRIKNVSGNDAHTELVKYEMGNVYVKRFVKRDKDKVDDSFVITTKDNIKVRVKPLMLTRKKVQHSVLTALRKSARELIEKIAKETPYTNFTTKVVNSELQRELKGALKKVYPLAVVEIRTFKKL